MDINYIELGQKAHAGAFSELDAEILVPAVMKLEPKDIYLEVGVDKGRSLSIVKMMAKEGVQIYGVDLREDPKVEGTNFTRGDSVEVASKFDKKIDVIFIDGDHTYEGCKRDIEAWYPHMKERGIMFFHDCDESSPGVVQAVFEFFNNLPKDGYAGIWLYKYGAKNTSMCKIQL
jgi:hypothetical protein